MISVSFLVLLATAQTPAPDVVLERVKAASGGSAWERVATIHARAQLATSGLEGALELWEDVRTGRSASRYELGPVPGSETSSTGPVSGSTWTTGRSRWRTSSPADRLLLPGSWSGT